MDLHNTSHIAFVNHNVVGRNLMIVYGWLYASKYYFQA